MSSSSIFAAQTRSRQTGFWHKGKVRKVVTWFRRGMPWQLLFVDWNATPYLNAGCGGSPEERFVNLDRSWWPGVQLCWNIVNSCPAPTNSLRGVYTEHLLEHVSFEDCQKVLQDFWRALRPGGVLRVVIPDAGLYTSLYCQSLTSTSVQFPYQDRYNGLTAMMHVNRIFRAHGHQYAYDYDTIKRQMEQAGFIKIKREDYRVGRDPHLLADSAERRVESLYVEGQKP